MTDSVRILLVEDDEDDYFLTADSLEQCTSPRFELSWAKSGAEAIELLKNQSFDLCLLDYVLGQENAMDVLAKLKGLSVNIPVVVLTGQADNVVDDRVMRAGAADFLTKLEVDTPRFMRTIRYALVRREIETERLERNRVEQQNRAKDKFLAHLGHELRTPLSSILGYTELLLDSPENEHITPELSTILNNGQHLLSLLNDLLDMSRIMANKLDLVPTEFNLTGFLTDLYSLMVMQASEKGLLLTVTADALLPETINSDPTRLRQVLINLTNNAIKFTDNGEVNIHIDFDATSQQLCFTVKDSGIGMPQDKLQTIFRPFEQIEDLMQANHGGAGLGLAISNELVQLMGGRIDVESEQGKGSRFWFTIDTGNVNQVNTVPLDLDAPVRRAKQFKINQRLDGRVLIVDDLREIRRLTGRLVGMSQASVSYAQNGTDALEKVRSAEQKKRPFHLILMDIHMPVMNGIDCLRALRKEGIQTPVVAVTAASRKGLRESLLSDGFDNVIAKPVDRRELSEVLDTFLIPAKDTLPVVDIEPDSDSGEHLLVVEDDEDAADLMCVLLKSLNHQADTAHSGQQALQTIAAAPDLYCHVLMDLHLPDTNGYELIAALQQIAPQLTFTIISGAQPDQQRIADLPVSQTLLKPVTKNDLATLNF
ncbi:response regulator [Alteromonas gilva]|uniref:histidine kinase n=1 Tax=Alteromonas gilva TaxID=2987522 RepID=A0ABT5L0Y3_9ALTE|nr:response regulator [Alteromonas gilva]MDC8830701.1 response regulator [Alteromonas gilva]